MLSNRAFPDQFLTFPSGVQPSIYTTRTKRGLGFCWGKCFILRRESARRLPRGPIEHSLHFIGLGKVYWISKSNWVYRVFFWRRCFIPRREMRRISSRGSIGTLSIYCLSTRILHFQNQPSMVTFSPLEMFYPRREMRSISSRGSIDTSFHLSPKGEVPQNPLRRVSLI